MLVYIAGPLFSVSEREENERIEALAKQNGFETFLPQRDAGLAVLDTSFEVFTKDVDALKRARLVVANLNGHDVDAGTAWEVGFAIALGKMVIGVRDDRRSLTGELRVNPMLEHSVLICQNMGEIAITLANIRAGQLR